MFKSLNALEKSMCKILKAINNSPDCFHIIRDLSIHNPNALHQCVEQNFIENIAFYPDANGNFHFDSLGNTHVNRNGLTFLQQHSLPHRIKLATFDLLKGTLGFILGILSTLIAELLILLITSPETIEEFLLYISGRK